MAVTAARRLALAVVRRVGEREAYAPETLNALLAEGELSPQDAAFATRLAYGTIQYLGVLDEVLDRHVTRPDRLEPSVRDALRLGAYEILFMRTPARAAVHQGVETTRSVSAPAAGLANAVLRAVAGEADSFPYGDESTDIAALARATGHPSWLADLWTRELGLEVARGILEADREPAPLYLRHNPFRASEEESLAFLASEGMRASACPLPGCFEADPPALVVSSRAVSEGHFLVTDAAAQLAPLALAPRPGEMVVDAAAGRGTKTALLQAVAHAAGGAARILALDLHAFKTDLLARRMEDLSVPSVETATGDARAPESIPGLPAQADGVLLDAPCSGLGALRRHPEKRWRVTPDDLPRLATLQTEMLAGAARLVRPGGAIVYSTCTVSRAENAQVIEAFLGGEAGKGFRTDPLGDVVPDTWGHFVTPEGWFQSLPSLDGPDGHFVARLAHGEA
jgi:16S rRNA (cytosine967-C5)-methyltransferase